MNPKTIYKRRLFLFAKALEQQIMRNEYDIKEVLLEWPLRDSKLFVFYHIKFNVHHFNCLLNLFDDAWYFNQEFQEPQLRFQDGGLPRGFIEFFGLSGPEEFIHFFDCQGQYQDTERWGGSYLFEHSPSVNVARNIFEFISNN